MSSDTRHTGSAATMTEIPAALATAFRDLVEAARRVPRATIGASQNHLYLDPLVSDRLWAALDAVEEARK